MLLKKYWEEFPALDKKVIILAVSLLVLFSISIISSYFYFARASFVKVKDGAMNLEEVSSTLVTDSPDTFNILLLGYGGAGHDGGNLTDSITLASINTKEKEVVLISIPRDLWIALPVDYDNKQNYKINAAYAIGGNENKYPNKKPIYRGEKGGGELAKYELKLM
jgi:anionic cell wall polymer biosynthesis LytR-Cps2A-Psr (LCP) family protein